MPNNLSKIAFAGAGNVAWHLASAFKSQGLEVTSVWSRNYAHAQALAQQVGAQAVQEAQELALNADLIIIAVADNAIVQVAQNIGTFNGVVAHTAGSVSLDDISGAFQRSGVLYPLQTFTKDVEVTMSEVPFLIETSQTNDFEMLKNLAEKISGSVQRVNSATRLMLHVAAVFANNYTNFMLTIAEDLAKTHQLPAHLLHPLMQETVRKAIANGAYVSQTGPARRNDFATIKKHLDSLSRNAEYAKIYRLLTESIIETYS